MSIAYSVAALDLDETLLNSSGRFSEFTLQTLQRWRASGRRLVIATGRPPRSLPITLPGFLHDVPWICYNGAEIYENGMQTYHDLLPAAKVSSLIEQIQTLLPTAVIGVELGGVLRLSAPFERPFKTEILSIGELGKFPAAKVILLGVDYAIASQTMARTPAGVRVMLSEKHQLVQMMSPSADKATALQVLMQRWGVAMNQVIAIGDDVNDVDMIHQAGLGVAMGNAIGEVQVVANRLTVSNDEDGAALILNEFV